MKKFVQSNSLWADVIKRLKKDKIALLSLAVIIIYLITALLSSLGLIFQNVTQVDYSKAYLPPSSDYLWGTDIFGRDVLAKLVHGTKTAISVGLIATIIAMPIGISLGALAGYLGGWVDDVVVAFYTTFDSIPGILLIIALAYALGPGITNAFIAIGLTSWVSLCRLMRAEFMKNKEREYVVAARALGASNFRITVFHILPNTLHLVLIHFSLSFIYAIKSEVILSYLGLGVEPGQFSWGLMIDDARNELTRGYWWQMTGATVFMFGLILSFNLFNDALRSALDPKLKNK